ncbi:hypothetical protein L208DRAFT_1390713 [Tricholoma matsutake]|nr:hypothetical protein L208DRAFT_1390713 [Tricholoma matsutake 945]
MPGRGPSKRVSCFRGRVFFCLVLILCQGVGIAFGPDVTEKWCTLNGVSGIIRSHEVRQGRGCGCALASDGAKCCIADGYQIEHDGLCTTVSFMVHFSLPC